MIRYQIPKVFLSGFKALSVLTDDEVAKLAEVLRLLPVGANMQELENAIKKEDRLSDAVLLSANTVFSLGGLLLDDEGEIEQLAADLSDAFVERIKEDVPTNEKERLKKNLFILFENADNLKKTFKAYQLLSENAHTYRKSRIVTDIRLIFDDNFDHAARSGLILHQLKFEYLENNESKEFFISLDSNDILKLREDLSRAMEKEICIKRDHHKVHFINIKD